MTLNSNKRAAIPVLLGLLAPSIALWVPGCKKDEPPPPPPTATAEPTQETELALEPEDAGVDADADAKKVVGKGTPAPSLKACCNALAQNAASAPPPNNVYMTQAAAVCHSMVAQGQGSGTILGAVRGALKGAGMPSACR